MTRKKKRSPAFQFYPSDFLGSPKVRAMNAAEIGVYTLLLCLDWEGDGFTLEEAAEFAESHRVTRADFATMWDKVGKCFATKKERFFNQRLRDERKKQREWRRKSSKGGKLGMEKRWGKGGKGGYQMVEPNDNTPSPSLTPSPLTTHSGQDAVFGEAWAVYPKRPGNSRADSYKQWMRRVKDGVDPLDMLEGTRRYARYVEVEGTEQRFVKMAQTFFGPGRHFEDQWAPSKPKDELGDRVAAMLAEEDEALARTAALLRSRGVA